MGYARGINRIEANCSVEMDSEQVEPIVVINGELFASEKSPLRLVSAPYERNSTAVKVPEIDLTHQESLPEPLRASQIVVIDSVKSGTGRSEGQDVYDVLIKPLFRKLGLLLHYFKTESVSSVGEIAGQVTLERSQSSVYAILLSGDTSVGEFVNGIDDISAEGNKLYLANVALGTGNAMLASLQIKSLVQSVSNVFSHGKIPLAVNSVRFSNCSAHLTVQNQVVRPLSSGSIDFVAVFSWLFHSALVADSDNPEMRKLGLARFGILARENLNSMQSYPATILHTGDGRLVTPHTRHSYLVFTLLSNFEPTFKISPRLNLKDLYMVEVNDAVQHLDLMEVMSKLYKDGIHVDDSRVEYRRIEEDIELVVPGEVKDSQLRFCVDGSIIKLTRDGAEEVRILVERKKFNGWQVELVCQ